MRSNKDLGVAEISVGEERELELSLSRTRCTPLLSRRLREVSYSFNQCFRGIQSKKPMALGLFFS
jgi:hypothetical protein